ncbi:hypothetical protein QFZ22_005630 [Streptomyces canus]|uniref:Major facilitator superfamily (MFS) profile domain-containing protein n=1 Tax=Streptomyces canus TaxID=58343 RepID=A0AAW8FK35_9ACTN|nr:hypothetical protein [Streptomyces canus]MDQ0909645.1 hypothetical protein [Streptomyces canus]
MVVLNATIVTIALPSAQQDLGMSDANRLRLTPLMAGRVPGLR